MLLTPEMFTAGIVAAICQFVAHQVMRGRTYTTPIPRYSVGVGIALTLFSLGFAWNPAQQPVSGAWYVFIVCGAATWLGYELDRRTATLADADRILSAVIGEHSDDEETGRDSR